MAERDGYDSAFGEPLEWQSNREGTLFKIVTRLAITDPADRADGPRQHACLSDRFTRLAATVGPAVTEALAAWTEQAAAAAAP